ncbi:MAG: SAM-dependent methyltransferase [Bacteroidales bacterium]|nr:SAM-dependent methyltransferase [Bacteroidales bacterium]
MTPSIYMIPSDLGKENSSFLFPEFNTSLIESLSHFIVEDVRSARRFIRSLCKTKNIDEITFYTLNKHTEYSEIETFINPIFKGFSIGVISEAGCPGVADPGAVIVALAHEKDIRVIPLIGPSSILLSLMASGFNGQSFTFNGYIPLKNDRIKFLKQMEYLVTSQNQTQIFMETPYRNVKLLDELLQHLNDNIKLCIACNVAAENEYIKTKTVVNWKKKKPDIDKKPTIFILGR